MSTGLPQAERFLGLKDSFAGLENSGCVILPVPFEQTSTYKKGSRFGPEEILAASQELELFDCELKTKPFLDAGGIHTAKPILPHELEGSRLFKSLEIGAGKYLDQGKFLITLGGEHTSVVGAIKAHATRVNELTILHLDAHSDLREEYDGTAWNHACTMARVLDFHKKIVQVGVRSQCESEYRVASKMGIPCFYAHEIPAEPGPFLAWAESVVDRCKENVYLTLDCDVFDPSVIPTTGTPEPDGLSWRQVTGLLNLLCQKRNLVGLDVSELRPVNGFHAPAFIMAKLIYRVIARKFNTQK